MFFPVMMVRKYTCTPHQTGNVHRESHDLVSSAELQIINVTWRRGVVEHFGDETAEINLCKPLLVDKTGSFKKLSFVIMVRKHTYTPHQAGSVRRESRGLVSSAEVQTISVTWRRGIVIYRMSASTTTACRVTSLSHSQNTTSRSEIFWLCFLSPSVYSWLTKYEQHTQHVKTVLVQRYH